MGRIPDQRAGASTGSAFGHPGLPPTWARADKQGLGTAATGASPLWFTLAQGVVTELHYPRVDVPSTRDLQFLVLPPDGAVLEERRDLAATVEWIDPRALAYHVTTADKQGRFTLDKRIVTDPERPCLVMRVDWRAAGGNADGAPRLFLLLAPHVGDQGRGNSARVVEHEGRVMVVAQRHDSWLAMAASVPFLRASCGFVGASDGWTDLTQNRDMTWTFAQALDGNVAITAELGDFAAQPFTVVVGFGDDLPAACAHCAASLDTPYADVEKAYIAGWRQFCSGLGDLSGAAGEAGSLYYFSAMILRAHEDRENPGAYIASLATPWGESQGDSDAGGYHLVWPRDLYHTATALLAAGDVQGASAALHYLWQTQRADGSWPQNFWVYGAPYWTGLQLDEVAFPILLAWQLRRAGGLAWNPYASLVAPAAYAVARIGPVTPEERWEENPGYSPSTLAASIAALVCAAEFAQTNDDPQAAAYFLEVADSWESQLEEWTYTTRGEIGPGLTEYYERIAPPDQTAAGARSNRIFLGNQVGPAAYDARSIVDSGFLELVRYGIRPAADQRILHSLRAYDAACKVDTPVGPAWHRYNHDGYGQKADGSAYDGTGVGRAWPLLTGERGHYEVAAGGDAKALLATMEKFASCGLLPEQVWDEPDLPEKGLRFGGPTGSAAPLCWAHAEYIKLLRSIRDGSAFDCPEPVRRRYASTQAQPQLRIWKFNHKFSQTPAANRCRIEVHGSATLHWSDDDWRTTHHDPMEPRGHGIWVRDWEAGALQRSSRLCFTFYWHERRAWEGRNFTIEVVGGQAGPGA